MVSIIRNDETQSRPLLHAVPCSASLIALALALIAITFSFQPPTGSSPVSFVEEIRQALRTECHRHSCRHRRVLETARRPVPSAPPWIALIGIERNQHKWEKSQ